MNTFPQQDEELATNVSTALPPYEEELWTPNPGSDGYGNAWSLDSGVEDFSLRLIKWE